MKSLYTAFLLAFLAIVPAVQAASVDINTADAGALDSAITGVGPVRAQAIVDYRTQNGPFDSVDELVEVKGIGNATVDKNRSNLTAGEQ